MGDRLPLIETPEFETTPEKMLDVLCRIVADRGLGMVFFKDYFLMDVELLGGGGRTGDRARDDETRTEAAAADAGPVPLQRLAVENRPDQGQGPSFAGRDQVAVRSDWLSGAAGSYASFSGKVPPTCRVQNLLFQLSSCPTLLPHACCNRSWNPGP